MVLLNVIYKLSDFPQKLYIFIKNQIYDGSLFSTSNRSDSDSTPYTSFVASAIVSEKKLNSFRKDFRYRLILEHVDFALGFEYLRRLTPATLDFYRENVNLVNLSKVGSPRVFFYPDLGWISPTIIRYLYVNQSLQRLFGESAIQNVAEIGIGFGGQAAITSKSLNVKRYSIYDLPVVLALAESTLEKAELLSSAFVNKSISQVELETYDLVISNYAFSELPEAVQRDYIAKMLGASRCGYITMNSGRSDFSGRSSGKMSLTEITDLLPSCEILEEDPKTGPDNYIIVWGHKAIG
jgi:putative sugar O-methyltransferase